MKLRGTACMLALSTVFGLGAEGVALAQEPDPNVPVTNRPRPDFDPIGIRAGSYLIFPELGVSIGYDDNITAASGKTETVEGVAVNDRIISDGITSIIPVIEFDSEFSRHALDFTVGADLGFYFSESNLNYQDVYVEGSGRYDVTRDDGAYVNFVFGRFHDDFEDPNNAERVAGAITGDPEAQHYLDYGGTIGYRQTFNRFFVTPYFVGRRVDFEDSINSGRDDTRFEPGLRAGYAISPRVTAFLQGSYFMIDRDEDNADGSSRDSDGYRIGVGSLLDFTGLIFGEFSIGYINESFDTPGASDEGNFDFNVGVTWNVTTLTSLGLNGRSRIESTAAGDTGSDFRSFIDLTVDHELLRNLLIGGLLGFQRDDFGGERGTENTLRAGVNGTYFINRNFRLELDYLFSTRSADRSFEEFDRNRVFLTVVGML